MVIYIALPEPRDYEDLHKAACLVISEGHLPVSPMLVTGDMRNPDTLDKVDFICMSESDQMWIYGEELNDEIQARIRKYTGVKGASNIIYRS